MGTRCLTQVYSDPKKESLLCTIYRQSDGYYSGHGGDLKSFLGNKEIINGISDETLEVAFNGMGCLAAALISNLKTKIGSIYIYTPNKENVEQYVYEIYPSDETFERVVGGFPKRYNKVMLSVCDFNGPIGEFDPNSESVGE